MKTGLSDDTLIRRVAEKDSQAFAALYHRYAPKLSRYLWRMSGRQDLVEEAVNDVMMTVWKNAARFDFRGRLSSWLFGIAYKKGLRVRSVERRDSQRVVLVGDDDDYYQYPARQRAGNEPDACLDREQAMRALAAGLKILSDKHRTVIELACFEGLSYRDISLIIDCHVNTVKTRMFHARKTLSSHFSARGFDPAPKSSATALKG